MNSNSFNVTILTLYPEVFPGYLGYSKAYKGLQQGLWSLKVINIRDFARDKYKTVDDKVFGGGAGLLIKPDVLGDAIEYAFSLGASKNLVYPNPRGHVYNTTLAKNLSLQDGLTIICGHFEGIDQRIIDKYKPLEISIGDYILSGGELSTMVILDSALRHLPNMINSRECVEEESFNNNLLEYPNYTRPFSWQNLEVPDILLSGHHENIAKWRKQAAEAITRERRPDLWLKYKDKL